MALYDIVGKAFRWPLYRLLGGLAKRKVLVNYWCGRKNPASVLNWMKTPCAGTSSNPDVDTTNQWAFLPKHRLGHYTCFCTQVKTMKAAVLNRRAVMKRVAAQVTVILMFFTLSVCVFALARPGVEYKIFQFPADKIPRIDGDPSDWSIVPETYSIGMDQLKETTKGRGFNYDKKDLDVKVKVGWVKGLHRLYFLYEAYDNYWDFDEHSRHNDIFEVVVDGDLSGGPLVTSLHPHTKLAGGDAFFQFQGVHAQNYHIFTPAPERDWAFVWGCQPWIKELPWANSAYNYNFKHGESGKLILEFWITPFDYAPFDGPERAVVSKLTENKRIGLSWAVLDYDGPDEKDYKGFWNLSHKTTMYGNADDLVAFRLMPLEAKFLKPIEAHWSYKILDMDRRLLAFQDESTGQITSWRWDFGDGAGSTDRHPIHQYEKAGEYIVNLYIEGPGGKSRWTKVRDVVVR